MLYGLGKSREFLRGLDDHLLDKLVTFIRFRSLTLVDGNTRPSAGNLTEFLAGTNYNERTIQNWKKD